MKEEDLDQTKPITTLKDFEEYNDDNLEVQTSRTEKNNNILAKQIDQENEEAAEEALAEKNIAIAEAILEEETTKKEEPSKPAKDNIFTKLKDKWSKLSKSNKVMIIIICLLILIFIALIIAFIINKNREEEKPITNTPPTVEEAPVLGDNYFYQDGTLHFLDLNEKEIGTYTCDNKDSSLCYLGFNNINDNFDVAVLLNEKEELKAQRYPILNDNYVFVVDNEQADTTKVNLYSIKDQKILAKYNDAKVYDNNYAIVSNEKNQYGLIHIEDGVTQAIDFQYEYLGMISGEDNLVAKYNRGYKIIDKTNKKLSSDYSSSAQIKYYNKNFIVAKVSGEYNVYDYNATLIASDYDFITVADKYIALVKDNKLIIEDANKLKYNEVGVNLKNNNYVRKYIYDENDTLKETKKSFEINVKEGSDINILVYDDQTSTPETITLKIVEALANEKYQYLNYFDKKLYFYSDAEKEKLLGYYTCSNANDIKNKEDNLNNCYVATDTIYEDNDMVTLASSNRKTTTPLINNRYVFISDGSSNIILYDLKTQTSLSSSGYASINTNLPNNDYTFDTYLGPIDIIALNKKGKYGMITINGDNITTKYIFDYNKMEYLGDYILVLDSSNKWHLISSSGNISVGYDGKIRGYSPDKSYLKVYLNNQYYVYDTNNTAISTESYAYVELYNNYYAAVNKDMEVNIYNYQGEKLSTEGIKIGNYAYYKTDNPAFKVTHENGKYIVSVYNGSDYEEHTVNTDIPSLPIEPEPNEDE